MNKKFQLVVKNIENNQHTIKELNEDEMKFIYCNDMYEQAKKAARISLPHTLPSGLKVIHGARMEIVK